MNKHARLLGILAGTVLLGSIVVISLIALSRFVDFGGSSPLGATYKQVASCSELAERMNKQVYYPYYADGIDLAVPEAARDSVTTGAGSAEYSTTNVQVAGVDEADIIKTDGAYIYVATNNAVFIIDAEDPSLENYLAKIDIEDDATARGLFVQGDNLVIFADSYGYGVMPVLEMGMGMADEEATISSRYQNLTTVLVYDTSDVREPMLVRTTEVEGNYQTSRMIDQRVYIVGNYYPNYYQNVSASEVEELIPRISDSAGNKTAGQMAQCDQVALFGNEGRNFVTVVTLDLGDESFLGSQVLVGNAQTVYMSESSLVLAATEYPSVETTENWCSRMGMCPTPVTSQADPQTLLFKLGISTTGVDFAASGVVPGTLLNQFSLDEHSGYLRVVTTVDNWGVRQDLSVNNLYVLDGSLGQVGAVEDLAMGERVYSARFMGDRAYMVTFQTIDPLFVIDLSNPEDPKVLGELKIPGYSDYLHPYDETHILGFGKDTDETGAGRVTTAGLKVALFDVTDPTSPVEVSAVHFGGKYSESNLLYDHKALLFDREKHLLVMPATLYPDDNDSYGQPEFYGFLVLNVDLESGITERGRVVAYQADTEYYYYGSYNQRSLYVGDVLYSWDGLALTASDLESLGELGQTVLVDNTDYPYYIY